MNFPALIMFMAALTAVSNLNHPITPASSNAPPITEVQRQAISHARLDPSEISTWKKRARMSALLPKLQVNYARRLKYNVDVSVNDSVYVGSGGTAVGPDQGGYTENQNSDNNIEVKAVWDFSEAVFNPDQLAVSEEARLLARERQAILSEVCRNYYERERFAGEIALLNEEQKRKGKRDDLQREIFSKRIKFDEATAALDALTGGWFSNEARRLTP